MEAGFQDEPLGLQVLPVELLATVLASMAEPLKDQKQRLASEEFLVVERRGLECYTCGGPSQMCSDHHQETPVQCYPNVTTCSVGRIKHKITREVNIVVMIS